MNKIYGYKNKDLKGLMDYIENNQNLDKKTLFERFAILSDKSVGTVRNMYYALAKKGREDGEFCKEFLGGKVVKVAKIQPFSIEEERELVRKILIEKQKGKSVRQAILFLTKGNDKLALRYQNKYRNFIKAKPEIVREILGELNCDKNIFSKIEIKDIIPQSTFERLKKEINLLFERVSKKLKKENEELKERVAFLKLENLKLHNTLYRGGGKAYAYFSSKSEEELIN